MAGSALGSLGSVGTVAAVSGTSKKPSHAGKPQFADGGRLGYAKGTYGNPVTPRSAAQIQRRVLSNRPTDAKSGVATLDPVAEAEEYASRDDSSEKVILGFGMTWSGGIPNIVVKYGPDPTIVPAVRNDSPQARAAEQRAHGAVEDFVAKGGRAPPDNTGTGSTSDVSTSSVPNPSDDWNKITSVSQDTPIYFSCTGKKVGYIEQFSELYKNTSETQTSTSDWALTQTGYSNPACDNNWNDETFRNEKTIQTQNWQRSDLAPVDHLEHAPVKDKKSSFDTTITASYGGGSINMDYTIPYINRDVQYDPEKMAKTVYFYPYKWGGSQAQTVNCNHEQVSIWRTENPSSGDRVAPTYYYGRFSDTYRCGSNFVTESDSIFGWLKYQ